MGIAYAALAPGAVATAIGALGDGRAAGDLPARFTGEDTPAAALAILEPRPLFDPLELETKARRDGDDWVLDGVKSLVAARRATCELFVVAAEAEGHGPALFVVESGAEGLSSSPSRRWACAPPPPATLLLEGVEGARRARCSARASPSDYAECVQPRADRLVRARGRHLAGGARLRHPLRQRAQGVRRTDLQPPGASPSPSPTSAIESDGMRLATYRAASRADQGKDFAREAALARRLVRREGR